MIQLNFQPVLIFSLSFVAHHAMVYFALSADIPELGAGDFLPTLIADATVSIFLVTLLLLFKEIPNRWVRWVFSGGLAFVIAFAATISFGFAKLYQRPFHLSFIRLDSASIWSENLISAYSEAGWVHLGLFVYFTAMSIYLAQKNNASRAVDHLSLKMAGTLFVTFMALMMLHFKPWVSHELAQNFLLSSFSHQSSRLALKNQDNDAQTQLTIPLLASPVAQKTHENIKIERKRNQNIILYFLESTPHSILDKQVEGRDLTPNLNALARKSIRFERHYANFPLSINSFYSAFCSAYPLPDGAWISLVLPDFQVKCLSEILHEENYRNIILHAGYLGYAKQKRFLKNRKIDLMEDAQTLKRPPFTKGMGPWGAADERAMIAPLKSFIKAGGAKPFFATLFAFAPHHPYNQPENYPVNFSATSGVKASQIRYFNSLHFADFALGEILRSLESDKLLDNTILIIMGDHGEAFYEHRGNYNHPFFLYEENIHVPMLIYSKNLNSQTASFVTSHVDILPTILDLLDLRNKITPLHVGRSMLQGNISRVAHIQAYWQEEYSGIVTQNYKYILKENGLSAELFDLQKDPNEKNNLAEARKDLNQLFKARTVEAFAAKRNYYKQYGKYNLTRFNPASQDR